MPPKKKAVKAAKAPVKKAVKAPAKRPVGRPRKPLGTRVSDVDLLANVGSTKPMPRRVGRDALEQQRARLRYAVDYPGRRFTEQMTRALQDSFATGALPYGVSLRAPANFARPYTTSFEPIAGMPVWPAINVPPNADAEDALRLVDAAQAAAAAVPDPSYRPTKRAKRSGAPILASLSGLNPGTSYVRDPNDTSEVYVPDTSIADRQAANRENMNKLAFQWMDQRQRELAEVRSASFARRRREGQLPKSQAIQDMNEELRRQNAAVSFPAPGAERAMLGIRNPPTLRSDQERALLGLDPRRRPKSTSTEPPPGDEELTSNRRASRPLVSPAAGRVGSLIEPSTSVLRLRRKNPLTPEMQAIADQLAPQLLRQEAPTGPVPTSQVLRLRQADTTPVLRLKGPAPPPNVLRLQGPAFDTRDIRAADAAIARDERRRKSAIKERAKNLGELLSQRPSPPTPPAQQMVVSVPDPVAVNTELQGLKLVALQLNDKLALQRSGKSQASTLMELRNVLGAIKEKEREVAAATPSSEPAQASVPQSIVVPGTEAPTVVTVPGSMFAVPQEITVPGSMFAVPQEIPRNQPVEFQRALIASQDAIDRQRLQEENAALIQQREQYVRGAQAREAEIARELSRAAEDVRRADIDRRVAEAPSFEDLRKASPTAVGVTPEELEAIQSFVMATVKSNKGYKPGSVDALMAAKKEIDEEKRNIQFQRQADALNRANRQIADPKTTPSELRTTAALQILGRSARERLLAEADRRDGDRPGAVREPSSQPVPTITPAQLAMVSREIETDRAPANTAQIPPPSNPPEPQSEMAIPNPTVNGSGMQHVTAATFPSSKWTTASSLRWLRSNGLHPIRKSTKINGAYSYALQSPAGYSSFNSVKMSHKNKDFTIVYGTPK